jgi:hypothetical protein
VQLSETQTISAARLLPLGEYLSVYKEEIRHVTKLCVDYQLYSPHLDGTVDELLGKVIALLKKNVEFLSAQVQDQADEHDALVVKLGDLQGKLDQQIKHHGADTDAMFAELKDVKEKLNQQIKD